MSVPVQVRPSAPKKDDLRVVFFYFVFRYRHFCFVSLHKTEPCDARSFLAIPSQAPYKSGHRHQRKTTYGLSFFILFFVTGTFVSFHSTKPCLVTLEVFSLFRRKLLTSPSHPHQRKTTYGLSFFILFFVTGTFVSFHSTKPCLVTLEVFSLFRRKLLTSPSHLHQMMSKLKQINLTLFN